MGEFKKKTNAYPKRGNSKPYSRPSGRPGPVRGPSRGPSRGSSYGSSRGSYDRSEAPAELFEATCADCGNSCQVPFKPNGRKPVYCRDCFRNHDQESGKPAYKPSQYKPAYGSSSDYDRPSSARPSATRMSAPAATAADVAKLSQKLDKILEILENHLEDSDDEDEADI